jgi:hypothetical protein
MQIFSEDLSEALDLNDKSDMLKFTGRKEEIQRLLRAAVVTAAKTFQSEQLKLKDGTVKYDGKTLTSEQEWFLKVNVHDHIGADGEPETGLMDLAIDVGRCLGFHRQPKSESWAYAGRSYNMKYLCSELYRLLHPDDAVFIFDNTILYIQKTNLYEALMNFKIIQHIGLFCVEVVIQL